LDFNLHAAGGNRLKDDPGWSLVTTEEQFFGLVCLAISLLGFAELQEALGLAKVNPSIVA
jgi:hypothetical protein